MSWLSYLDNSMAMLEREVAQKYAKSSLYSLRAGIQRHKILSYIGFDAQKSYIRKEEEKAIYFSSIL